MIRLTVRMGRFLGAPGFATKEAARPAEQEEAR